MQIYHYRNITFIRQEYPEMHCCNRFYTSFLSLSNQCFLTKALKFWNTTTATATTTKQKGTHSGRFYIKFDSFIFMATTRLALNKSYSTTVIVHIHQKICKSFKFLQVFQWIQSISSDRTTVSGSIFNKSSWKPG